MQTEVDVLLKAVDEASAVLSGAADKIKASMGQVEGASAQLDNTQKKTDASAKDLAVGFSGVATAGFSLYMTIDRVEKSNYALEKANLAVQRSNESVDQAQKSLNAALEKYGANSTQAKDASDKLSIAQGANSLALERANLAQGNVNQAMMQGALTVIPAMITMVSSAAKVTESWGAAQDLLNKIMLVNPIYLVVAAIAAIIAALILAYQHCEPFRNAVNAIGNALGKYLGPIIEAIRFSLEWLWNNVLVPLGQFLYASFVVAIQAVAGAFQWLANVLLPVTDAIWGFFNAVNSVISTVGGAIGGFCSWVGDAAYGLAMGTVSTIADMTGQSDALTTAWTAKSVADVNSAMDAQLRSVRNAYEQQTATIDQELQKELSRIDTFYATLQADAKTSFDAQYADFLAFYQAQLEPAQETELQKLVDKWVEHFDTEISDMNESYDAQIAATTQFFDDMIAAANEKLNAIRESRKADLDDLELNMLLQKEALKTAFEEGKMTTEEYNKAVSEIEKTYNADRKETNDDYRLKELEAEKDTKAETERLTADKAARVEEITAEHVTEILEKEQEKSDKTAEIENRDKALREEYANTVAQLEQAKADETRVAVIAAEEAKTAAHEKFEGQTKTIVETAEAEKQRIITESNEKILNDSKSWGEQISDWWGGLTSGITDSWSGMCSGLSSWWNDTSSGLSTSVGGFCAGVTDWFNGLSASITGGSIWPDMLESMVGQASSGLSLIGSEFSKGLGFVEEQVAGTKLGLPPLKMPEFTLLDRLRESVSAFFGAGAAAPAGVAAPAASVMRAVGAGSEKPSVSIQISGPLVNVEGSMDREVADYVVGVVEERLKSVIVEASSSCAPSTSKMIRIGNRVAI